MTLPELSVYEGYFGNGYFHGEGVFNLVYTPMIYKGNWVSGKKHGHGWLMYEADDWYEGEWVDDRRSGLGFRHYKSGEKYEGTWSANKKEGNGKMIWNNNDYYTGEWSENQPHGYGEYFWEVIHNISFCFPSYNWYKGSWENGVRNGIGMNLGFYLSQTKIKGITTESKHTIQYPCLSSANGPILLSLELLLPKPPNRPESRDSSPKEHVRMRNMKILTQVMNRKYKVILTIWYVI
nr:MORN repeat-containing protein 3-like [Leptinotarsa decemlineata]